MMQRQAFGVQHKARKFAGFSCGIDRVAQDRAAHCQHMHPQLMAAPGQRHQAPLPLAHGGLQGRVAGQQGFEAAARGAAQCAGNVLRGQGVGEEIEAGATEATITAIAV